MKKYIFNEYNICIREAPPYSFNSTDNKCYDSIIVIEEKKYNKSIEIEVEQYGEIRTVLMVVPYYTPIDSFVAPHRDGLFMMLNDVLCVFSPDNASVTKQIRINPMGTMFEVHRLENDYILYGEMEISSRFFTVGVTVCILRSKSTSQRMALLWLSTMSARSRLPYTPWMQRKSYFEVKPWILPCFPTR